MAATDKIRGGVVHPCWRAPARVHAAVSTRAGGCSAPPFDSCNVGADVGDDRRAVAANRRRLRERLGLPSEPAWLEQEHGCTVVAADGAPPRRADASVSFTTGAVCAVTVADCLPVLFCDRNATCVAAAHAGWRGLASGVLEATVAALDCEPRELIAWLGPAIGPHAFRVGDDVRERFLEHDQECALAFLPDNAGAWLADLYRLARLRLARLNVGEVAGGFHCTFTNERHFFSHRRDGRTGRMAACVWLAPTGAV